MQRIYHYDRTTGVYMPRKFSDGHPHNFALPSPAEPGEWIVPAFATTVEPPEAPVGMLAVFDRDAEMWRLVPAEIASPPPPPPTAQERAAAIRAAVTEHLDVVSRGQGFKGIDDAVSYAEEPAVVRYQMLGRALRSWRSVVRAASEELIAAIDAGTAQMPASVMDLYAMLPRFVPPTAAEIIEATALKLEGG